MPLRFGRHCLIHIIYLTMRNLSSYKSNTHIFGLPSPKMMGLEAIIAGAGIGMSGIGTGLSAVSQFQSNATNEELTREGWKLQQEEAEKARLFNSEEAQKAREYYSEQNVMQRRSEAGLNTALSGSESATSGPSASGSGASISSPIPNVAPTALSQLSNLALQALGLFNDTRSTSADILKKQEEAKGLALDNLIKDASKEVNVSMQNETLENLRKSGKLLDSQNEQVRQALMIERQGANQARLAAWYQYRSSRMQEFEVKRDALKDMEEITRFNHEFFATQRNFYQNLRKEYLNQSYQYGKRVSSRHGTSNQYQTTQNKSNGSGWSVNGKFESSMNVGAGIGVANVGANTGFEVGGNYTKNTTTSNGYSDLNSLSQSGESTHIIRDNPLALISAEVLAICDEFDKGGHTLDYVDFLAKKLMELNLSYDMYLYDLQKSQSAESINLHMRPLQ